MQKLENVYWIFGALILCGIFIANVAPVETISQRDFKNHSDISSENDIHDKKIEYEIIHITEISHKKNNVDDDKKHAITTYQQQTQTLNLDYEGTNHHYADTRLLQIETKGFDDKRLKFVYLFVTQHNEQCKKNAYSPAWKIINNETTSNINERFNLEIKFRKEFEGKSLFLCIMYGDDEKQMHTKHLGKKSLFNLSSQPKSHDIIKRELDQPIKIIGFHIMETAKEPELDDGIPVIKAGTKVKIRFFGSGFSNKTKLGLTTETLGYGEKCHKIITDTYQVQANDKSNVLAELTLPEETLTLFICVSSSDGDFYHQGVDNWLILKSHKGLLPLWMQLIIIFICLCFSALFSGLNLGLMSLDRTDLKILCNTGSESEKKYAQAIQPVRDHGNYLLCSILLGNVLVNSTFTILLDSLTSGLIAVVCSTLLIVIFGEITPQAICSRHGLAVGARTIFITKFVMLLTFPLSYPTSKILDYLLGEEIGTYYNRERLKELVKVTTDVNDLDKDEVNIISGVLEMRKKTVGDIQTHIEDAYMLPIDAILDFETISEIMNSGYSRIPVYENDRKNIISVLYIKDLAFVDTDDNTPLRTLCEFYQNPCHFVFDDLTLDVMFKQFKEGNKGHMAFVHRVNNDGEGDPFYETVGLVTLEDVIEELIQAEIMDETDVYTDNRSKNRRLRPQKQDFSCFIGRNDTQKVRISPQLTLATFQFLSTTLEPFKRESISENILRRLLNQDIYRHIKNKSKGKNDPSMFIFQQGKPVDFFVMILEGRVEVTVGRENLIFEGGPFTHFGLQALIQTVGIDSPQQQILQVSQSQSQVMGSLQSLNMDSLLRHTFIPDYSVRALTDVVYLVIKRSLYMAAKRATLMEQSKKMGGGNEQMNEPIDDEVEKLLHSLDEDDSAVHTNLNSPRMSKPTSMAPSPTSQQNFLNAHSSNQSHNELDGGIKVTFSQSSSTGNHVINFMSSQKNSVDVHDGTEGEVDQPLLNKTLSSKSS
ncbi:hypothetical protein PVAND_011613 [Polypedilum vanderplanki]|uniref:Uncharacterized protein n=1 Tax=Polypedilum vanderplanki TaxID=319348 RepID=A0A9J6CJ54_POLVA|nr:hypothetical protein PVAND_011613 [Polypedilum vanderplanki]